MPVILHERGFIVRIYGPPREHGPPHVHVERGASGVAVVRLSLPGRPARLWKVLGMSDAHALQALALVQRHEAALTRAWREIHGTDRRRG